LGLQRLVSDLCSTVCGGSRNGQPRHARLLAETADLLEIDGGDSFRIRSYRRAAEAAEQTTVDLVAAARRRPACLRFRE